MLEGSVSLFFGSYGLLFYFYDSGFPACPFSRVFQLVRFLWSSGLPVFPGFRFARFPGFPACSFSLVFRLARFPGFPVCPFSRVSGLLVFSGSRFARFLGLPACPFFLVSGLPVFPVFSAFSRAFRSFFCFISRIFPFFCSVFARWLFCFVRSEGNTQIQCQNCKLLIIRYSPSGECPEMDTF